MGSPEDSHGVESTQASHRVGRTEASYATGWVALKSRDGVGSTEDSHVTEWAALKSRDGLSRMPTGLSGDTFKYYLQSFSLKVVKLPL